MTKKCIFKSEEGKNAILKFYDGILSLWPQSSKQLTIKTNYGETFLIESGSKSDPPIILLHGSSSNSAMWLADVKELSKKYHVFSIDIIGECGKSESSRPPFVNNNYSSWISEIIEQLKLDRITMIGNSLGGWIAIDYACKYPDKVEKLILMATAGVTQIKFKTIIMIIITSFLGSWGFNKLNKMVYGNLEIDKQALEFATLIKKYYIPRTDILPIFTDDDLHNIKTSILFIGGENDCFYNSSKTAERLKNNLSNFEYILLKNVGHVLLNQTQRIIQFLSNDIKK